jgi:ABC-type glycerol-3-phosphate transport system substrate-binding protein
LIIKVTSEIKARLDFLCCYSITKNANIPEYPQINDNIRQAIEQIYNATKEPKQALDEAAFKSAKALGW